LKTIVGRAGAGEKNGFFVTIWYFKCCKNTNFGMANILAARNATCPDKIRYVKNTRKKRVRKQRSYGKNRAKNVKNGAIWGILGNRDWNSLAFQEIPGMLAYKTGLKRH